MKIVVLGAYLPRLDQPAIASFIAADVAEFKRRMVERIGRGRSDWALDEVDDRASEIATELNAELQRCALFEAEVVGNNRRFHASDFSNPETGFCGWEPAFLSRDGETVITSSSWVPAELADFRVAFYVQEWQEPGRLTGPTGELELPMATRPPPRLWRLAPYASLD